jgi:hypothetical protein
MLALILEATFGAMGLSRPNVCSRLESSTRLSSPLYDPSDSNAIALFRRRWLPPTNSSSWC